MAQTNRNFNFPTTIRLAQINSFYPVESLTPMGRQLLEIAQQIANSDELPMSENDIENEQIERRGGASNILKALLK